MKAEEYDDLIGDPGDFHLSTYLPRICGALKPFEMQFNNFRVPHCNSCTQCEYVY